MVGTGTDVINGVSTEFWILYKCESGKLEPRVRIAKLPRDPSVEQGEANVLNSASTKKRGAIITLYGNVMGTKTGLNTVVEDVNTVPCVAPVPPGPLPPQ